MNPYQLHRDPELPDVKVRESRLRRMAERQGLRLAKSRCRDESTAGFGTYMLADAATNAVVLMEWDLPGGYGLDLDAVEQYLTSGARR